MSDDRTGGGADGRSTAELLAELSTQMTTLVHQEVALAKAELSRKGRRVGAGAVISGGAGILLLAGSGAMTAAAVAAVATALSLWLAALVVGAALLVLAGAAALAGIGQLARSGPPVPQEAIDSTREDVKWLKTQARSATR